MSGQALWVGLGRVRALDWQNVEFNSGMQTYLPIVLAFSSAELRLRLSIDTIITTQLLLHYIDQQQVFFVYCFVLSSIVLF